MADGHLTHGDYLVATRGLGVLKDMLTAVETHERLRIATERLGAQVARVRGDGTAALPYDGSTDNGAIGADDGEATP